MFKTKAFVVGVSNYHIERASNLEFCKNDILAIERALVSGLKLSKEDIFILGNSGEVKIENFENMISNFIDEIDDTDIILLYFSGHGGIIDDQHVLYFTDGHLNTQKIIEKFGETKAKSKIILLDCCHAGLFTVNDILIHRNLNKSIDKLNGKGCAILASSSALEPSYPHPEIPISVFTAFLCDAFQDKLLIKKGYVSLYDIRNLISIKLKIWNQRNKKQQQHPIFRASMIGTINFKVTEYIPFSIKNFYKEYKDYILFDVNPVHSGLIKKYSIQVILKKEILKNELINISKEIKKTVSKLEIYNNENLKKFLKNKPINNLWIFFGYSESDILNTNYKYSVTWGKNDFQHKVHEFYQVMKDTHNANVTTEKHFYSEVIELASNIIVFAESIITIFNEYENNTKTEDELFYEVEPINVLINSLYLSSDALPFPPDNLIELGQIYQELFVSIDNLTCAYNNHSKTFRSSENRFRLMRIKIKDYYLALDKFNLF